MTIIINLLVATIANIAGSFALYAIPNFKVSRIKFFLLFLAWGALLGNLKYFCEPNSTADLIVTLVNNVTLLGIFVLCIAPKYYKLVIAFGIYACTSFTSENFALMLGKQWNYSIYQPEFADTFLVHLMWATMVDIVMFFIIKNVRKRIDSFEMDTLGLTIIVAMAYFYTVSQMYVNRIVIREGLFENDLIRSHIFANNATFVFIIIVLVRTLIINKKNYIRQYNDAYEREKERLDSLMAQNDYIAKLRHDYVNQISVIQLMAKEEPKRAIDMLDELEEQYNSDVFN